MRALCLVHLVECVSSPTLLQRVSIKCGADVCLSCRYASRAALMHRRSLRRTPGRTRDTSAAYTRHDVRDVMPACAHAASFVGAPGATALTDEHMETIARHIGIDPFTDPLMLYILYTMEVKEPGEVPKENFVKGFTSMGYVCARPPCVRTHAACAATLRVSTHPRCSVPTLDALRSKVPTLRDEMNSDAVFPKFYVWCYGYSCEPGQRTLSRETATALAPILISTERWPAIGDWVAFLESQTKTVSKDTWAQVLTFART
ncbi:hypothetical protein EON66_10250, partial [archaeon]